MENKKIEIVKSYEDILKIENLLEHNIISKNNIIEDLASTNVTYAILYECNMPIGYISYVYCIDHIDLQSIAITPDFRKKGNAKFLMDFLNNNSNNLDIYLEVRKSNTAAISLYEKCQFQKIYERKNYYSSPVEDAFIYMKPANQ